MNSKKTIKKRMWAVVDKQSSMALGKPIFFHYSIINNSDVTFPTMFDIREDAFEIALRINMSGGDATVVATTVPILIHVHPELSLNN